MKRNAIWTSTPQSIRIRAFMAALKLRKEDRWHLVEHYTDSQLWLFDGRMGNWEPLQRLYTQAQQKPEIIIVGSPDCEPNVPHRVLEIPIKARAVLKLVDEIAPAQHSTSARDLANSTQRQASQKDVSRKNSSDIASKDWQKMVFCLKAWPNVSKYDSKHRVVITLTCAKIMNNYHDYQSVQQWGLTPPALDSFLNDTYDSALLAVKESTRSNDSGNQGSNYDDDENKGLVKRLLKRFGYS